SVECFRNLRRSRNIKRLVDRGEYAAIHQRLQQILCAHIKLFRQFANLDAFGDLHVARRTRLRRRNDGGDSAPPTRTWTLTRRMQLAFTFHLALVGDRPLALGRFARVKRLTRLRLRRHFVGKRRQHARPAWRARTRTRTRRHRTTALLKWTRRSTWP